MSQQNIPNFYRVWFTWVDPLTLLPTVYALLTAPEFMMDSLIPADMSSYNPDHAFFFHQLAALYTFIGIMLAVVLRATSDLRVWRIIIGAVLLVDIALLTSLYMSLEQQGRLELAAWRRQDWGNLLFTGWVTILRSLFLVGVGFGAERKGNKRA